MRGKEWNIPTRVPYIVDLCPATFELIDEVLSQISAGMEVRNEWPPTLERECVTVATLNLLNLQVCHLYQMHVSCFRFIRLFLTSKNSPVRYY